MFCPNCGSQNDPGSRFCCACGQVLEAAPAAQAPQEAPKKKSKKKDGAAPRSKKGGLKIFLVILSLLCVVAIGVVVVMLLFPKDKAKEPLTLTGFSVDERYLPSGVEMPVTFTVQASSEVSEITLYRGENSVGTLCDNGKNGDVTAGDNIYTCTLDIEKEVEELVALKYYCGYEETRSEAVSLYFFPELTPEAAQEAQEVYTELCEELGTMENEFLDENGVIPEENRESAVNKAITILDQAKEDGVVLHYQVTDDTISVKMTSGLGMIYSPVKDGYDAVANDEEMTVITCQPHFTEMGGETFATGYTGYPLPEGVNYMLEMIDVSGRNLRDTLPNYSFPNSQNYDNDDVTLEFIRSIGKNQVILWHGHGCYTAEIKPCLALTEPFDWDAYAEGGEYYQDYITGKTYMTVDEHVIVSYKYIEAYCGDMENTFIYLAACSSGKTSELANAFTAKGATVVANSESIMRTYNVAMLYGTVNQMLKTNPDTGELYTATEALAKAKEIYGDSDGDSRYGGSGATPKVFGANGSSYRFADDVPTGIISGKVAEASDRVTPIGGASIEIYLGENLFTSTTADSNGLYSLELPFGECSVHISADGYIGFISYNEIFAGQTTYLETFLMVQGDESEDGIASGTVINSISGGGESNVALTFRKNWNNTDPDAEIVATATTNYNGNYSVTLPLGNYTVSTEKEGFAPSSFNIVVQEGETPNQDGTITPVVSGNDYLITLTWGENPRDVDSHMEGTLDNGDSFHVYFGDESEYQNGELICNLDYDDVDSFGPEHITLTATNSSPYYYYLHKYAGSGPLCDSEATVTIEQGNRLIAVFHIPTNLGEDDYWNVFAIKDGEIIICNTITSYPDTEYAD